jgi:peptide/nickel transport system ATP-binding protein/oligopeptide transport system ATP-binding protein
MGGLLACRSRAGGGSFMSDKPPTLSVRDLSKHFAIGRGLFGRATRWLRAVDGISFDLAPGETLGLVGESGCGKSTAGKTILRLLDPTAGSIHLRGRDISALSDAALRPLRREMQMVFQDPYSSLNPRMSAGDIVGEPLATHGIASGVAQRERVAALFARVGLRPAQMDDYPHQFSGGQRQRVAIARALAVGPGLIVGDEPVSALDVSIQAQVINLLTDLQAEYGFSYLFIAHDLAVVQHISHRVAVMYLGRIVELAPKAAIFAAPRHPYTEALLSAVPIPDPKLRRRDRIILAGDLPSPASPPRGCHFHTRCPRAIARCTEEAPVLRAVAAGHQAACHLAE